MAEKNIFVYKLFLSLNISDFIFFVKIATSPWKSHTPPLFRSNSSLKVRKKGGGTLWVSIFGVILVRIFSYSVRMPQNTEQNNSEYKHFLRSGNYFFGKNLS